MAVTSLSNVAGSASASGASSGAGSGQEIAGNFQQFLLLLTTQLKNQSPLDPLDTNQFTQQLVQFASVEQQLKTNSTLTSLVAATKASAASTAASLVGSTVTVDGSQSTLANGTATWSLSAPKAGTATVTITDSTGAVVATQTRTLTAGAQSLSWDGRTQTGGTATTGTFKIAVSARDAAGQSMTVSTDTTGTVTSVDMSGDAPVLSVGGRSIPLAQLKSIGG